MAREQTRPTDGARNWVVGAASCGSTPRLTNGVLNWPTDCAGSWPGCIAPCSCCCSMPRPADGALKLARRSSKFSSCRSIFSCFIACNLPLSCMISSVNSATRRSPPVAGATAATEGLPPAGNVCLFTAFEGDSGFGRSRSGDAGRLAEPDPAGPADWPRTKAMLEPEPRGVVEDFELPRAMVLEGSSLSAEPPQRHGWSFASFFHSSSSAPRRWVGTLSSTMSFVSATDAFRYTSVAKNLAASCLTELSASSMLGRTAVERLWKKREAASGQLSCTCGRSSARRRRFIASFFTKRLLLATDGLSSSKKTSYCKDQSNCSTRSIKTFCFQTLLSLIRATKTGNSCLAGLSKSLRKPLAANPAHFAASTTTGMLLSPLIRRTSVGAMAW
mmetsp:Transcript_61300/g.171414  ORF Transcript_61300/g.171414 Transcript_61300/m.171414 type:complete len:388 (+) Transcript_61300:2521-3684(+)